MARPGNTVAIVEEDPARAAELAGSDLALAETHIAAGELSGPIWPSGFAPGTGSSS